MSKKTLIGLIVLFLLVSSLPSIAGCSRDWNVSFDSGIKDIQTITVITGEKISSPETPWKPGYSFNGWYYLNDEGREQKWDFEKDTVNYDITLYAKWDLEIYRITLELNGGQCEISYIDVSYGQNYVLPEPRCEGRYFHGWFFENSRQGDGIWKGSSDITIEAKWLLFDPDNCPTFGAYEQDCNEENGKEPIEWYVLDESEEGYFLLSKYILDTRMIESGNKHKPYKDCELRKWFDRTFYYEAFSSDQRNKLLETYIEDADVTDEIFIISYDEMMEYLYQTDFAETTATAYAKSKDIEHIVDQYDVWWLRNVTQKNVPFQVYPATTGYGSRVGATLGRNYYGVRPAIWVEKNAIMINLSNR